MFQKLKQKIAVKLIEFGIRHYPEYLRARVEERAKMVSQLAIMKYLSDEGLLHCQFCPRRFSLRKHGGKYVCPAHYQYLIKESEAALVKTGGAQ